MIPTRKNKNNGKRICVFTIVAGAILYTLYCFVIAPAYISSLNNVAYEGSLMPDILNYLGRAVEVVAMSLCYALAAFRVYSFGKEGLGGAFGIYLSLGAYKYVANMLYGWTVEGGAPVLWYFDLLFALLYLVLETLLFGVVCLIFIRIFENYHQRSRILARAGREESVYPFVKLYDKSNPLLKAALASALALLIPKLLGQIINDAIQIVEITNLPLMILSYFLNIIFGVLGYITVIFAFVLFFEKMVK